MIVSAEAMRLLIALHKAAEEAAARRDEAMAIVFAMLGAAPDAQIVLLPDGSGEVVVAAKSPPVGSDTAG